MIIIVDDRDALMELDNLGFGREGISTEGLAASDFHDWVRTAPEPELAAVEAFVLGECSDRRAFPKIIKQRSRAPVLALTGARSLQETLDLFASGVDDVIGNPTHIHEILARIKAIKRRASVEAEGTVSGGIRVFGDGRDPDAMTALELSVPTESFEPMTTLDAAWSRVKAKGLPWVVVRDGKRVIALVTRTQMLEWVVRSQEDEVDCAINAVKRLALSNRRPA